MPSAGLPSIKRSKRNTTLVPKVLHQRTIHTRLTSARAETILKADNVPEKPEGGTVAKRHINPIPGRTDSTVFLINLWDKNLGTRAFLQEIIAKLWAGKTEPIQAIRDVFGRDTDDSLLACLFYLLFTQKKEAGTLVSDVARNREYENVEDARIHIDELRNRYCAEKRATVIGKSMGISRAA